MQIKTNLYKMKRNEFFGMLVRNYFKKRLWLYLFVLIVLAFVAVSTIFLGLPIKKIHIIYAVFSISMPLYYIFSFWCYSGSKENAIFYRERIFNITDNFLETILDDDSFDKMRWSNVLHYKKNKEDFLLYVSKHQFFHIPKRIFTRDSDYKQFETFLSKNISKK